MNSGTRTEQLVTDALKARGIKVKSRRADGRLVVNVGDAELLISLDNVARDYERGKDKSAIDRFVTAIARGFPPAIPWDKAKSTLRFTLAPTDLEIGDAVHDKISSAAMKVLVCEDQTMAGFRFISRETLTEWGVDEASARRTADSNMNAMLARTPLHVDAIETMRLGMFSPENHLDAESKAALILAPELKKVVSKKIGWPVYAVIPCCDFLYIFPVTDKGLIERVGPTVVKEYKTGAYPITTEVLEISDGGIKAIGKFPTD